MFDAKVRYYAEYAAKHGHATYLYMFKRVPPSSTQSVGPTMQQTSPLYMERLLLFFR